MSTISSFPAASMPHRRAAVAHWVSRQLLPLGLLVLLTGLMWAGDRSNVHTLYYTLVAFPCFVALILDPRVLADLGRSPIFVAYGAFAAYCAVSIAWTDSDQSLLSLLKRPLYIALLFAAVFQAARAAPERLVKVLRLAATVAVIVGAVSLVLFLQQDVPRFQGFRAFRNPILTSHVFGFFMALCIAAMITDGNRRQWSGVLALLVLGSVIVATGSRGALGAIAVSTVWVAILARTRRGYIAMAILLAIAAAMVIATPEILTQRGTSYRPEIWAETLRQFKERPWLGYGYESTIVIRIAGVDEMFPNPHNMLLAVLRQQGIVGLALWLAMYATALTMSWRHRRNTLAVICSGAVVFGLMAGMTEGVSYLSRPKEHWFMIWIPLALLATALATDRNTGTRDV